jgi:hypothetical protein
VGRSDQQATINAMLHHFKQAATLAVNSIQNEAICAEQPVKSYSTTLLATVALRTDTTCLQLLSGLAMVR